MYILGLQCAGELNALSKDDLNSLIPKIVEFDNTSSVEEIEVEIPNTAYIEIYDVSFKFSSNVSAYVFDGTEYVSSIIDTKIKLK